MPTNFEAESIRNTERTLEEFISMGMQLREEKDGVTWKIGDLAEALTLTLGPGALPDWCREIAIPLSSVRRYRDVAKSYPPAIREEFNILSWSHFRAVSSHEHRLELLKRAADETWSVEKLIIMAKAGTAKDGANGTQPVIDDEKPVPPRPELYFCEGCRKWYILQDKGCPTQGQCQDLAR